ncbi:MAG: glycosyltransferase family 4 protein [Bacteroidales bacterium]|jgi:glycosyltransferase involved in cell wall biosynthesis|nr:glycosyltransferase family 4 protein [Bacteroidales bacterium]
MKIAFDVQPLVKVEKTGVAFSEFWTIKTLQKLYKNNDYFFNFFSMANHYKKEKQLISLFKIDNSKIDVCTYFHDFLYNSIGNILGIPYPFFFKNDVEITHFFNYFVPPGVKGKKIVTVHDMTFKAYPETMHIRNRFFLNHNLRISCERADKILTFSEFSKDEIIRYMHIDFDKIKVIPHGVDTDYFHPISNILEINAIKKKYKIEGEYFFYLGTMEPRKNLNRLIQAYKTLRLKYSELPKLIIAGRTGWLYKSIFNTVNELNLRDDIIFPGYIQSNDLIPLLCGAFCFVFPSLYEGFGLPLLEAMACGVPVVTSNVSSIPEVVGNAAITVNPLDIQEIANGIELLFLNKNVRTKFILRGHERVKRFTWQRTASMLMELYNNLLAEEKK